MYGIQKLRVVDASVMTVITNSNTNAPTIAIGEKASQDILDEYTINQSINLFTNDIALALIITYYGLSSIIY